MEKKMNKECIIDHENSGDFFNNFGNYKSCVANKLKKYYILENGFVKDGSNSYGMALSVCASKFCSPSQILKKVAPKFNIIGKLYPINLNKTKIYDIQKKISSSNLDSCSTLYLTIVLILLVTVIYSTYKISKKRNKGKEIKKTDFFYQLDISRNFHSIFYPRIKNPSAQAFDIIRALCMFLVIFGHQIMISHVVDAYSRDKDESYNEWAREGWLAGVPQNGIYAVTAFFFMGGYVSILSGRKIVKKGQDLGKGRLSIIFFMVIRRIFRILPMMLFFVIFYWKIFPLMVNGPGIVEYQKRYVCKSETFFNILSLPIFTMSDGYEICGEHLWYIQSDMRFFILTVFLNNFVQKKKHAIFVCVGVIVLSSLASVWFLFENETYYASDNFFVLYHKEYFRARIYFLGCLLGYLTEKKKKKIDDEGEFGVKQFIGEMSVLSRNRSPVAKRKFKKLKDSRPFSTLDLVDIEENDFFKNTKNSSKDKNSDIFETNLEEPEKDFFLKKKVRKKN